MRACAIHQYKEQRDSDRRGQRPDRELARGHQGSRHRIGDNEQRAAGQCRGRQDDAMVAARDQPNQVRDDKADESNDANGRHGQRCRKG